MNLQQYRDAFGMASLFASQNTNSTPTTNTRTYRFSTWSEAMLYAFSIVGLELKPDSWEDPKGLQRDMTMPHPPPDEAWLWDKRTKFGPIKEKSDLTKEKSDLVRDIKWMRGER
tara:strand:+ start:503 stop:844 length:342 start_codon:yes stop_codon:yes gene_type:complete